MPAPFAAGEHRAKLATVTTTFAAGAVDDQAPLRAVPEEALWRADGFGSKAFADH